MKSHDAYAMKNFDVEKYFAIEAPPKLADTPTAELLAIKQFFFSKQNEFAEFNRRLCRHHDRLRKFGEVILSISARADDETYYRLKPKIERLKTLSEKYTEFAKKCLERRKDLDGVIYNVEQNLRGRALKIFAAKLKQARQGAKLTQAELARRLFIKKPTLTAYETARNEPPLSLLIQLSQEFNRPADWFLKVD